MKLITLTLLALVFIAGCARDPTEIDITIVLEQDEEGMFVPISVSADLSPEENPNNTKLTFSTEDINEIWNNGNGLILGDRVSNNPNEDLMGLLD